MYLRAACISRAGQLLFGMQLLLALATSRGDSTATSACSAESDNCTAICTQVCPENSVCVAPEHCDCIEGYAVLNRTCQPICTLPCTQHAACVAPESCECLQGYALAAHACVPQCTKGCGLHEYCYASESCRCQPGYEEGIDACLPVCPQRCPAHAFCERPNYCACTEGFQLRSVDGICIAEAAPACRKELHLWSIHMSMACEFYVLVQLILFGCVLMLLLLFCGIFYKLCSLRKRDSNQNRNLEYVITYQPQSHSSTDVEVLIGTLNSRSLPPSYKYASNKN